MKKTLCYLLFIFSVNLISWGCTKQLYRQALSDAAHPSPAKICQCLTIVKKENPDLFWSRSEDFNGQLSDFVLMASWKKAADTMYYQNKTPSTNGQVKFYSTNSRPVFVTAYSDLQKWYTQQPNQKNINKRLIQLLGLPPDTSKRVFVLFWVRPEDLIRPCIDTEVTDDACDYKFTTSATIHPDCENIIWLTQFIRDAYSDSDPYKQYPFTQLGYTYDWKKNNKQHVGMSEFVIGRDKYVRIAGIYGTDEFLKSNKNDLHLN